MDGQRGMLPRTVASFYGGGLPRPYIMRNEVGEVVCTRIAKPCINTVLVGAWRARACRMRAALLRVAAAP
jgi:hypothetical protein